MSGSPLGCELGESRDPAQRGLSVAGLVLVGVAPVGSHRTFQVGAGGPEAWCQLSCPVSETPWAPHPAVFCLHLSLSPSVSLSLSLSLSL